MQHRLLANLGPEPLSRHFNGHQLALASERRNTPIKAFIMDAKVVVGVGNIYANEALFEAKIHPSQPAHRVSKEAYHRLARAIKSTLRRSIKQGGTSLKDFSGSSGEPGYFKQYLNVYGRDQQPCHICGQPISKKMLRQRATYWCESCQK